MDRPAQLGEFLRSRRALIRPEDVGVATHGRRRVPGLRREELAQLAGVSVDYYVRLEQGRAAHPSESVLDAIARSLRLDEAERAHLHDLARPRRTGGHRPRHQRIRPELQRLLSLLDRVPAFILGRRMDILAWNPLAAALLGDFDALPREQRNMARLALLDEPTRRLYPDWERVARETVAVLRLHAGRHPDDPELAALVGELSLKSEQFRRWWGQHDVRERTHGVKRFDHPSVGELTLAYETFQVAEDPDQILVTYTAEPGSPSETALSLLASLAAEAPAAR